MASHSWSVLCSEAEKLCLQASIDAGEFHTALNGWRTLILAVPGGDMTIANLCAEEYLTLDQKAQLLFFTVAYHRPLPVPGIVEEHWSEPFRALERACQHFLDAGDDVVETPGTLARFVSLQVAHKYYVPLRSNLGCFPSPAEIRFALSNPRHCTDPDILLRLRGTIRGALGPNIFSTIGAWVDGLLVKGVELASRIRDGLALPHLDGQDMIEMRIDEHVARASGTFKKPTFADASGRPVFRPSDVADKFGFARDLASYAAGAQGGPEIWHGDLPANSASSIRYVGAASNPMRAGYWTAHRQW